MDLNHWLKHDHWTFLAATALVAINIFAEEPVLDVLALLLLLSAFIYDVYEEIREKGEEELIEEVKRRYRGEGYVAVDKRDSTRIASAQSSEELTKALLDKDYDPEYTVIVNC